MDRLAADIDSGNTRRSEDNVFLGSILGDMAQEGRFSRSGFAGKENRAVGCFEQRHGREELAVVEIYA